jgi:hypothetical protein
MSTRPNTARTTITDVLDALQANLPNLKPGIDYTLEQLVGKAFWNSIPTGERTQLGIKFKAMAKGGALPIRWVECKSNNTNVYQLK